MTEDSTVPIPPTDAERHPTACRYCIVGCGYEVYKWPVGEEGGPNAEENAFGMDYPASELGGQGVTTNQHTIIEEDGQKYNVIVKPDDESPVNNNWSKGDHSIRGGTMAQSLYGPENQTGDRLKYPRIRIDGDLAPVDWETAAKAVAKANELAMEMNGPNGVGMKLYFYQFVENTYAGTKLMFDVIGSPNWGGHNRPALTPEDPGIVNAGLHEWTYAYEDTHQADNILIVGAEPYENQSIIFQEHIHDGVANNDATPIYVQPRRTFTANYAENNGGEFLQVNEATDAVLLNSIARRIVDKGWENSEFINNWTVRDSAVVDEEGWYQKEFGVTFEGLKSFLQGKSLYKPTNAAKLTGVPAKQIRKIARLIGKPNSNGEHPRTTFLWEKGLIWGWSHENTAAMANLVLLTGSVGKPGAGASRLGGHQEGFAVGGPASDVIAEHSTQTFELSDGEEVTIAPNTIERVKNGEILHWHVIGCDPVRQSYNTDQLQRRVEQRTGREYPTNASLDEIERAFRARMERGGMVITNQEMYPRDTAEFADILLPATSWGEESNYHRWNGDRRLRHYSGFMEGPEEAKPDWQIFSMIGQEMGATDMNWENAEEIFAEIAQGSDHGPHAFKAVYEKAQQENTSPAAVMEDLDTTGVRMPAKLENGELKETPRLHTPDEETPGEGRFYTSTGKAIFMKSDWARVSDVYDQIKPDPSNNEVWITNGRVNRLWQNLYTHMRDPYIIKRFEQNFIELNPADADRFGVEAGDLIEVRNDDVYNMHGENTEGSFTAVAYVTEEPPQGQIVPEGTAFTYWLYPDQENNDIAPEYLDPANPNPAYKYGSGQIVRLGESELKEKMSFQARNIAPE
jgi:arsenite oxidase large subunit